MPRGRKKRHKSADAHKPPLMFTESPVHIVHDIPSPAIASHCPPTADVVSIDKDASVPWVSPQFPRRPNVNSGILRKTRRARNISGNNNTTRTTRPRTRQPSGQASSSHCDDQMHAKYKALKFLGDETAVQTKPQVGSLHEDLDSNINCVAMVTQNVVVATKEAMLSVHNNRSSLDVSGCANSDDDNDHADHSGFSQDMSMVSRSLKRLHINKDPSPQMPAKKKSRRQICINSKQDQQDEKESTVTKQTTCTQRRPKKSSKRLKELTRRLFESGLDCSDLALEPRSPPSNATVDTDGSSSPYSENLGSVQKPGKRRQSLRLQANQKLYQKVFQSGVATPISVLRSEQCNILVYDTPEEEYGLNRRQRRLKYLRNRKRVV